MNNAGGALNFNAVLNLNEWRKNVEQIRKDIAGLNQETKKNTSQMDSAFRNLSVGIASYFSVHVVRDFITELINVRGEFQQMENAIETITGSTQVMNNLMDEWKELTLRSPFRLSEIGQAGKQLLAYGISVEKVTHDIEMLANVASGISGNIGDIAYVYGTLKTQGRAYTRDILQFTMRGIPIMEELAKVMGVSVSEMKALIEAGKVGFPEVEKAMNNLTSEGGKFNNLIGKQATTLTGSVNRLKHEFELMLNEIGQSNESILKGGIDAITHLIEHYKDLNKILLTIIETYGAYRAALIITNLLQAQATAPAIIQGFSNLIKIIRGVTVAQETLNAASIANPYVLLATVIAALIAVVYNYREELGELLGIIDETTNAQKAQEEVMNEYHLNFSKNVYQTKATMAELINTIKNESSTMDMRKAAYERLIKIDKAFIGVLDGQYKATNRLGQALEYVTQKIDAFAMAQAKASASRKLLEQSYEAQFERDAVKVQIESAKAEAEKWRKLDVEARKRGKASLEYLRNAKKYEDEVVKLEKELAEKRRIANERTGVSNAIIRQNNKEVKDATNSLDRIKKQISEYKKAGKDVSKLLKDQEKLENFLNGFKPKSITEEVENKPVEGWAERIKAQIEALEAEAAKAPNQAAYLKIKARIKQLNDLLNPPKEKKDKQWAEIIPEDSIKALQRNAQLLEDAIDTASKGMVKLRKLDKYGNDKDKKGNPLLTGEIIPVEEAYKRLQAIRDEIEERKFKTSQEKLEDSKKLWEQYYKVAEQYGEKTANALYSELFKGSQNYLQYVENEIETISKRIDAGEKLTQSEREYFTMLQDELSVLNGKETYSDVFKRNIESALRTIPSLIDQLEYLNKAEEEAFQKAGGNTNPFLEQQRFIEEQRKSILQRQKEEYAQFLTEHETYEQKKLEIEKKYDDIRKSIQKSTASAEEKDRLLSEVDKDQAKDLSALSLELFQKTDLWVKAFGDLEKVGPRTLKKIREGFRNFLDSDQAKTLKPEDLKTVQDAFIKLDETIESRNPFAALGNAIQKYTDQRKKLGETEKKYGKNSEQYIEQLEATRIALSGIFEVAGTAANATIAFASDLGGALGLLSDEAQQTLRDVQQLVDGIVNVVAGYFSGNYGQMLSGIVQIISAMVKLLSGDKKRERQIREWQRAVDDLKSSYEELQKVIEKTAGESALKMQRELIANLKEQQRLLIQMRNKEAEKKKSDADKIASFNQQINAINTQIQEIADNFKESITTTDFKSLSQKIADALVNAFGQGEDAAKAFNKVVDDVMRDAVANALRIKILEPAVQKMVDSLYSSMGFGNVDTSATQTQIKFYQDQIKQLDEQIKNANFVDKIKLEAQKKALQQMIDSLQQQIADANVSGSFDGLTEEEREKIKAMGEQAMQQYMAALEQYKELFGQSAENAQGLKGDIKGITEKTAGALEAQINAMRINQVEILKKHKDSLDVLRNQLLVQTQIEINTRPLKGIYDEIKELNSKVKGKLAGIP